MPRRRRMKRGHAIRAITGNGLRPGNLARVPVALRHSAHRGILRRHRRQCLDAELRRHPGRGGPGARLQRMAAAGTGGALSMSRPRCRCAEPDGLCIECGPDEVGEAIGGMSTSAPAAISRAIPTAPTATRKSCAMSSAKAICLVSHRRPDAPRRATAISISSTASATPSAGRARMSPPARSARRWPRRRASWKPMSMAWRCPALKGAPAWRRWWWTAISISTICRCG